MKKIWLASAMIIAMSMGSCVDNEKDLYQEDPGKEVNTSDFSTVQTVQVEANYSKANSRVLFYIYDKNPIIEKDENSSSNTITLDKNIAPLDGIWTNDSGEFKGKVTLPAYVSDVYVISTSPFAKSKIEGKVENGILKFSDSDEQTVTRASEPGKAGKDNKYDENRFKQLGWETKLGNFDQETGVISYKYNGDLKLSSSEMKELKTTINKVLNNSTNSVCPPTYRTDADLYVEEENTAVALTALSGWTCWNNSLGYYYYRADGPTPSSLNDVTIYTIFPNTQTYWDNGYGKYSYPRGINEGESVQLKYFGNPAHPEGTSFPKGYKIGFVLATNAWNRYFTGFASTSYYSSSTKGLGTANDVRTAMFLDKNHNIAIAFEDYKDDQNFTDVLFALKASPEITNVPSVDPNLNTTVRKTGVYSFEDCWPKAYDYDMNDVLTLYTYEKTFNIYNEILEESFIFEPRVSSWQAAFSNGLAFSIKNSGTYKAMEDSIRNIGEEKFEKAIFKHENNVVLLTERVKDASKIQHKVTIKYEKGKKTSESTIDAFIFRPSKNDTRLEVHIPMQAPTVKVDMSFFGTEDDHSVPADAIYYVSNKANIYPFAFYLQGATLSDIEVLLTESNEGKAINELYPKFMDWARNNSVNKDWYKK